MKITPERLRKIIKEELAQTLNEWNEDGPVKLKVGIADYGNPGGLDELTYNRHTKQLDDDLDRLINNTRNAESAREAIDYWSSGGSGLSVPRALALYVIAKNVRNKDPEVYKHFKNTVEGGPSGWRAGDYFKIGGGSVNYEKFKELYPKLSKHLGLIGA
jgi:hypothetical protein